MWLDGDKGFYSIEADGRVLNDTSSTIAKMMNDQANGSLWLPAIYNSTNLSVYDRLNFVLYEVIRFLKANHEAYTLKHPQIVQLRNAMEAL